MPLNPTQLSFLSIHLGVDVSALEASTKTNPEISVRAISKARLEWMPVRRMADTEISRLKRTIFEDYKNVPDAQSQVKAAFSTLDETISKLDNRLTDALDDVLNAATAKRPPFAEKARRTIAAYAKFVDSNAIMQALDSNDIVADLKVTQPIKTKLQEIAVALGG